MASKLPSLSGEGRSGATEFERLTPERLGTSLILTIRCVRLYQACREVRFNICILGVNCAERNWHFQTTENHIFRLIRTDWAKIEARSGNPDILDDKARKPDPNPDIRVTNCPDIFADIWGLRIRVPHLLSGVLS